VADFIDHANGSTFLEISRGNFKSLQLVVPDDDALSDLDSRLVLMHAKATQLVVEQSRLVLLRDALLPELLADRARVSHSSGVVEAVA
jgi:type I restriction enzyme S subunit